MTRCLCGGVWYGGVWYGGVWCGGVLCGGGGEGGLGCDKDNDDDDDGGLGGGWRWVKKVSQAPVVHLKDLERRRGRSEVPHLSVSRKGLEHDEI